MLPNNSVLPSFAGFLSVALPRVPPWPAKQGAWRHYISAGRFFIAKKTPVRRCGSSASDVVTYCVRAPSVLYSDASVPRAPLVARGTAHPAFLSNLVLSSGTHGEMAG